MEWLTKLTQWFKEQIIALWDAFASFMNDFVVMLVKGVLDLVATAIEALPVPDFVAEYSIGALLAQAGNTVAWAVDVFQIGAGLGLIGAAYAFRLLRKFLTLFQW